MALPRYILAGGSGLVGRALADALATDGAEVIVLTRSPQTYRGPGRALAWDGEHLGDWAGALEGAAGIVNLTGRNVATRWNAQARREIFASRVQSATVIGEAMAACAHPPGAWINASATGIYGDRGDEVLAEDAAPAPPGAGFLGDVCRAWEAAVNRAQGQPDVRKVVLRLGVVFSREGGALPLLARITRLFAGGRLGSGCQWMPWIHVDDVVRAVQWALAGEGAAGTYNLTSPNPVTNAQLMRALRRVLRRPPAPPAPAWPARLAGSLLGIPIAPALASTRAVPRRLIEAGFEFQHPELDEALVNLLHPIVTAGAPR